MRSYYVSVTLLNSIQMVARWLALLWPFETSSRVRLRRELNAGPLTHKASPNQPTEGCGGPMSHEQGV